MLSIHHVVLLVLTCVQPIFALPYDYQRYFRALTCPISGGNTAYVTITLPVAAAHASPTNERFPTVLFLNGFVLRSCVYAPYVNALAAHGYSTIQFEDAKNPRSDFQVGDGHAAWLGMGATFFVWGSFLVLLSGLSWFILVVCIWGVYI